MTLKRKSIHLILTIFFASGMIVRSIHTCLNATRNLLVHRHVWMLQPMNNVQVNVNNSKAQKSAALSVPLSVKRHMMMVSLCTKIWKIPDILCKNCIINCKFQVRVMNPAKSMIIFQSVTGNVLLNVRTVSRIRSKIDVMAEQCTRQSYRIFEYILNASSKSQKYHFDLWLKLLTSHWQFHDNFDTGSGQRM